MEVTTAERFASGGPGKGLYAENLPLAFRATVERLGDDPAIAWFAGDEQESMSWNEVADRVRRIAGGFAKLGVGKGDTVAMMLNNRPEFIPMDLGAVSLGAVPFSIYQTSSPEQIQYVVADAGAKVAVVEKAFLEVFSEARKDLPLIERLIVVDGEGGDHTLAELEELDPDFDVEPSLAELGPDDLLTLIYTSGTTGPPKGVQLTHRNLMGLVGGVDDMVNMPGAGRQGDLLAADGAHRRSGRQLLPAGDAGSDGNRLLGPTDDHRVHAQGAPDVLLRRAPDLGEAEGGTRG